MLVKGFHDDFLSDNLPGTTDQISTLAVPLLGVCEDNTAGSSASNTKEISRLNEKVAADCINRGQTDQTKGMVKKDTEILSVPHLNIVLLVRVLKLSANFS